jgi:hypothetical protein
VHEYDTTLKSVLSRLNGSTLASLTGFTIERWHSVEFPQVRALRADLIGETPARQIVHLELQSRNEADMLLRMAEYAIVIFRKFRRWPAQIVLYVGESPFRMTTTLESEFFSFRCRMVDIRSLEAEPLPSSELLEDNIIAVLMHSVSPRQAVRRILERIAASEPAKRGIALRELAILAGLRSLGTIVQEETTRMPILDDIMDHDLFGPAIRRGMEMGQAEGYQRGERSIIARQMEQRFGPIPTWAQEKLGAVPTDEIERLALRLLDAQSLEELLS